MASERYREDEATRRSPGKRRSRRRSRYTIAPPEHMMLVTHFDIPPTQPVKNSALQAPSRHTFSASIRRLVTTTVCIDLL
jgi:hypothetical protein